MKQNLKELDKWYETPDPWDYQSNPEDSRRKSIILASTLYNRTRGFDRALDIAAGEAWISQHIISNDIEAIEYADAAARRFPPHVKRVAEPTGKYDLILLTGALYANYDAEKFTDWILEHASDRIVLCNIADREVSECINRIRGKFKQIYSREFPYRDFTQKLRVYQV